MTAIFDENGYIKASKAGTQPIKWKLDEEDKETICPVCGKPFFVPPRVVYKHKRTKEPVCSWSCVLASEQELQSATKQAPVRCEACVYLRRNGVCYVRKSRYYPQNCSYYLERGSDK